MTVKRSKAPKIKFVFLFRDNRAEFCDLDSPRRHRYDWKDEEAYRNAHDSAAGHVKQATQQAMANIVTAAEASSTTPKSNGAIKTKYHIAIPAASIAQDSAFVEYLTNLINEVYIEAEAGIFDDDYVRTNPEEVAKYLSSGTLALASTSSESPWSPPSNIQGCIRILKLSPTMGEVGMLVAAPSSRGSGLGRQLIDFGENYCRRWGATKMKLELLVPTSFQHKLKSWVQPWYERLGYQVIGVEDFAKEYPHIAPRVVTPTDYRVFEKIL